MNSVFIAHVADELQSAHDVTDYDVAADFAAQLLAEFDYLATGAAAFAQSAITHERFAAVVQRALDEWGDDR